MTCFRSATYTQRVTKIPYNRPFVIGTEDAYLRQAIDERHFIASGSFTKRSEKWLKDYSGCHAFLATSGTTALDMAALMLDLKTGDEVILPSYTFSATANAIALRGATPVFVDARRDTLNIDEKQIEAAMTAKTKAIFPIHYAGVSAELDTILGLAKTRGLKVVEDAAQCLWSSYKGRPLGSLGDLGTMSFHATKNVHGAEAGAVFVKDAELVLKAEIVREKGTNRSQFFRGEVDKYTWVDLGTSFAPSELDASFLLAQLESSRALTDRRLNQWRTYFEALKPLADRGLFQLPHVPKECAHNAHIFYLILPSGAEREKFHKHMQERGIAAQPHYVPLHSSPAGRKYGRAVGDLPQTQYIFDGLMSLPLWFGVEEYQPRIIEAVLDWAKSK